MIKPSKSSTRDTAVDALRGFALFGIILVNVPFFANSIYEGPAIETLQDRLAFATLSGLAIGKFFLIFSFLFGFGFATSISADAKASRASGPRFARRLFALLAFGMLHGVFFFIYDILTLYAFLGVFLWFARDLSSRTLIGLSVVVYAIAIVAQATALTTPFADGSEMAARANLAYLGGFWDAVSFRLNEDIWFGQMFILVFNGPSALSMFLAGLALAKSGVFPGVPGHRFNQKLAWGLLTIGLAGSFGSLLVFDVDSTVPADGPPAAMFVAAMIRSFSAPILSAGFGLLIMRAADRHQTSLWVTLLSAVGQMTLTGYLLHSIFLSFVFGGWGLGLYGQVTPQQCIAIGIATYIGLVVLFLLWRRWFRYGPDEWALRSWIDLSFKPFRN
jgi:uncharacterized protein